MISMLSTNLTCGMFDSLFDGAEIVPTGVKWGKNETVPFVHTASANVLFKEKDYDTDATPLYKAMEWQQWSKVAKILKDKSVNVEQANTWTSRKDPNGQPGSVRWRMTALHSALVFKAPLDIVQFLLLLSPQSASCKDDQGMLPLHLAFRNNVTDEILYELLVVNPTATDIKDKKGRTPLQCGVSQNSECYRWKVLGTYSAMVKASQRRERDANGGSRKLNKAKVLHEQELKHLNQEYESEIDKCNSQIISYKQEIAGTDKVLQDVRTELLQERERIQFLLEEINSERDASKVIKTQYDDAKLEAANARSQRDKIKKLCDEKTASEAMLSKKITELEDELFDWRNSLFGGSIRSLFFCQ